MQVVAYSTFCEFRLVALHVAGHRVYKNVTQFVDDDAFDLVVGQVHECRQIECDEDGLVIQEHFTSAATQALSEQ